MRELFLDAVRLRLRSDVPVGTCLSGGIDSSAIVCAVDHLLRTEAENARPVGERQRTFTAFFEEPGFDERPYAEAVVERTRSQPHWITVRLARARRRAAVDRRDAGRAVRLDVHRRAVVRDARGEARPGLKVMLDGQGADETLAGYHGYFGPFFADLLRRGRLRELGAELRAYRALHGAGVAHDGGRARAAVPAGARALGRARPGRAAAARSCTPTCRAARAPPSANGSDGGCLRRQMHLILTRRGLPELLHYEDRNSMAHSLEARVPFLDYRLVELLFSLGARRADRARPDEGRAPARARRPAAARRPRPRRQARLRHARGALAAGRPRRARRRRLRVARVPRARLRRRRRGAASLERHRARRADGRLRALARAQRRALGARVPLGSAAVTTQEQVREWWNRNPMSYDVDDPIPYEEGSQEFFRELDSRIFHPRYMRLTADASGKPFSLFVDFDSLRGKDVLEVGCGSGIADAAASPRPART